MPASCDPQTEKVAITRTAHHVYDKMMPWTFENLRQGPPSKRVRARIPPASEGKPRVKTAGMLARPPLYYPDIRSWKTAALTYLFILPRKDHDVKAKVIISKQKS